MGWTLSVGGSEFEQNRKVATTTQGHATFSAHLRGAHWSFTPHAAAGSAAAWQAQRVCQHVLSTLIGNDG
ncbi:hypothetical protein HSX11_25310 [Oxalobacteraceae bacterium]|nr:hypothetical protein [Oxalobacteraceae bacterium]